MWWSWLLMAFGVLGLWLAGRKNTWGWFVGAAAQVLWVVYGAVSSQYGFIVSACVYFAVYVRNFVRWRRDVPDS